MVAALAVAAAVLLVIVGLGGVARATPDMQLAVAITGTCLGMAALPTLGAWLPPDLLARPFVGW